MICWHFSPFSHNTVSPHSEVHRIKYSVFTTLRMQFLYQRAIVGDKNRRAKKSEIHRHCPMSEIDSDRNFTQSISEYLLTSAIDDRFIDLKKYNDADMLRYCHNSVTYELFSVIIFARKLFFLRVIFPKISRAIFRSARSFSSRLLSPRSRLGTLPWVTARSQGRRF